MTGVPQQSPVVVLVTGASGFVGRRLIAHLLETEGQAGATKASLRIVAATHQAPSEPEQSRAAAFAGWNPQIHDDRVTVVPLDVCDAAATNDLFARFRPQQVYHLAARASGADVDRDAVFAVNVTGTRNVLEAASAQRPFSRVLLASTGYVYGNTDPQRPAREEDPIGPLWRYGAYTDSKIEMETIGRAYRGFTLTVRAFGHTGAGQTTSFAVPSFARQLARIEAGLEPPELAVGNLEALRDLLDVRDVVRAYALFMRYGAPGDIVNVALGRPYVMREILARLIAQCTTSVTIRVDPARLRPADIACSTGNPALLGDLTGWTPHYSLDETLAAALNYWREQVKARP
jgi:GDP-4-dehydro-6-deoxy-D-mannose reductase